MRRWRGKDAPKASEMLLEHRREAVDREERQNGWMNWGKKNGVFQSPITTLKFGYSRGGYTTPDTPSREAACGRAFNGKRTENHGRTISASLGRNNVIRIVSGGNP